MIKCEFCNGEIIEQWWEQKLKGCLCPPGVYNYYGCNRCGMRYTPDEVMQISKRVPLNATGGVDGFDGF